MTLKEKHDCSEGMLGIRQVCELLGMGRGAVRELIESKKLGPIIRTNGRGKIRVLRSHVTEYLHRLVVQAGR